MFGPRCKNCGAEMMRCVYSIEIPRSQYSRSISTAHFIWVCPKATFMEKNGDLTRAFIQCVPQELIEKGLAMTKESHMDTRTFDKLKPRCNICGVEMDRLTGPIKMPKSAYKYGCGAVQFIWICPKITVDHKKPSDPAFIYCEPPELIEKVLKMLAEKQKPK